MRKVGDRVFYAPTDLVRYMESPYASWMDRFHLEHPDRAAPDPLTDDERLVLESGKRFEHGYMDGLKAANADILSTQLQIRRLEVAGITTVTGLASLDEAKARATKIAGETLAGLQDQAMVQHESKGKPLPEFRIIKPKPAAPRSGLALLPRAPGAGSLDMATCEPPPAHSPYVVRRLASTTAPASAHAQAANEFPAMAVDRRMRLRRGVRQARSPRRP